jgi:hypothetical protein
MAHPRNLSLRKEIQDYLQCCESLLSSALMSKSARLSEDEKGIVEYYAVEVAKLQPRQRRKLEYRHSVLEYIRLSEVLLTVEHLSGHEHKQLQLTLMQVVSILLHSGGVGLGTLHKRPFSGPMTVSSLRPWRPSHRKHGSAAQKPSVPLREQL